MTVLAALPDYVATYLVTSGKETTTQKIYFQNNGTKLRLEMKTPEGDMVTITRLDKKVSWVLMPQEKMVMEQSFDPNAWSKYKCDDDFLTTKAKKTGEETILGYKCDIYTYKTGSDQCTTSISQKEKIMLKSVIESRKTKVVMLAKDVKIGKQPDALFEIPPGYEKLELPKFNLGN
jgi:hypothetical protein